MSHVILFLLRCHRLLPASFYAFAKAPANRVEMVVFMFDVLAISSVHLPATSHVRSGLTRHRLALCIIVGASLGPLSLFGAMCRCWIVTASYSSSLVGPLVIIQRHASSSGHPHRRWVVTWPVLVVIGGPIHHHRVAVRAYSSSLERHQVRLVFIGSRCPTLRRWVLVPSCWRHSHEQKMSAWSEARKKENHAFVTY